MVEANGTEGEERLASVTPGEMLLEEFLLPLAMSQYRLAHELGVPPRRINEIVLGKRAITADTALRLGRYFRTTPRYWMNLQSLYELEIADSDRVEREVRPREVGV